MASALAVAVAAWWLLGREGTSPPAGDSAREDAGASSAAGATDGDAAERERAAGLAATGTRPEPRPAAPPPVTGPRINGRVVNAEGAGIGGAHVLSIPDTNGRTFLPSEAGKEGCPALDAIADAEGRFVVPVGKDAPFFAIFAEAAGYAPAVSGPFAPGADVVVTLPRPVALAGRVTDADRRPIEGARVRVLGVLDSCRIELDGKTDAEGRYAIVGLPPVPVRGKTVLTHSGYVEASAEGFAPVFAESAFYGLEPGTTQVRDFVLTKGATLSGRVVDAETDRPVADAKVVLWSIECMVGFGRPSGVTISNPWGPRPLYETRSDANGSFRFEHLPSEGLNHVHSNNSGKRGMTFGGVAAWKEGTTVATEEVPVLADGATDEVVLKVGAAATVTGRVVDGSANPLEGAWVSAFAEGRTRSGWLPAFYAGAPTAWARTDAQAAYRIGGAPVAREGATTLSVDAYRPVAGSMEGGSAWRATASVEAKPGMSVVAPDLVLGPPKGALRAVVRVLGPAGEPVWGAAVQRVDRGYGYGSRSGADGRVTLEIVWTQPGPCPPQTYIARFEGLAPAAVTVVPAADPPEVDVRLASGHRVSGRVLDAEGKPKASAQILVANGAVPVAEALPENLRPWEPSTPKPGQPPLVRYATVTAGDDGNFVAEDLPEGPYHVMATAQPRSGGFNAKPLRVVRTGVSTDEAGFVLVLPVDDSPPTGALEGTVVDATSGEPLADFSVTLRRGSVVGGYASSGGFGTPNAQSAGTSPGPGRYAFPAAPAGTWTLTATSNGRAPATVPDVVVVAGQTKTAPPIALGLGVVLSGTVRAGPGVDLKGTSLWIRGATASDLSAGSPIAANGTYRVTGLLAGRYLVLGMSPGTGPRDPTYFAIDGSGVLEIPEGVADVHLDLALVLGGALTFSPNDGRLPPAPYESAVATEEQRRFGEACRVELRRGDGTVIVKQEGLQRGWGGALSMLTLAPGRYVLRFEIPGEPPQDVPVDVEAGKRVDLGFPKR